MTRPYRAVLCLLLGLALPAQAADNATACGPNPVFKPFPGETLGDCEQIPYGELELERWSQADNPRSGSTSFKVAGEYWSYFNELTRDGTGRLPGKVEIRRSLENAVLDAQGSLLHADSSTVTYRLKTATGDYVGVSGCGRGGTECEALSHKVIRLGAAPRTLGVVGAVAGPSSSTHLPGGAGAAGTATALSADAPCSCACRCHPQTADAQRLDELACACDCQCGGARAGARPAGRFGGTTASGMKAVFPTLRDVSIFPARGTRGMAVVIAGPDVGQARGVLFGDVPAPILASQGDRITVRIPPVPSEAVPVHLDLPAGRVTVPALFQVYQAPDASVSTRSPPCPQPWGEPLDRLALDIMAVTPERAQVGQRLTLQVPGIGALRDQLQREDNARRTAPSRGTLGAGLGALKPGRSLAVAFTQRAASSPGRGAGADLTPQDPRALLDALMGQDPSLPMLFARVEHLGQDEVTVRVPERAVSGPLAILIWTPNPMGGAGVTEACRSSGPDLLVSPPAAR